MELKNKYPYCYSVAYRQSAYFRSHAFKVKEDAGFIHKAFEANDTKALDFMESFYVNMLTHDRDCEKDIMSKFAGKMESIESTLEKPRKKKKIKLEE